MYFASIINKATIVYFLKYQLTNLPFNVKIKPDVDFYIA